MQPFYQDWKLVKFLNILLFFNVLFLTGCINEPKTGPVTMKFDRDMCERCRMLISDRFHAAQVRGGNKNKAYKFDDIGGAIIWLDEQTWKDESKTEVWVTHHETGEWINAKEAWYVQEKHTPMNYGFSAEAVKRATAVDYTTMAMAVVESEKENRR